MSLFHSIKALIKRLNNENNNWTLTIQSIFLAIWRENCASACKIVKHGTWMWESKLRLHRVLGTSLGVGVPPTSKSGCRSAVWVGFQALLTPSVSVYWFSTQNQYIVYTRKPEIFETRPDLVRTLSRSTPKARNPRISPGNCGKSADADSAPLEHCKPGLKSTNLPVTRIFGLLPKSDFFGAPKCPTNHQRRLLCWQVRPPS